MKKLFRIAIITLIAYPILGLLTKSITCLSYIDRLSQCVGNASTMSYLLYWPVILVMLIVSYPLFLGFLLIITSFIFTILFQMAKSHELDAKEVTGAASDTKKKANNKTLAKQSSLMLIAFGVVAILTSGYLVYSDMFARFDLQHVALNKNFQFGDALVCRVEHSTFKDRGELAFRHYNEKNLSFSELDSENPQMLWGDFPYKLRKVFDGQNAVVLQNTPIDERDTHVMTIHISKEYGTFTFSSSGFGQYFGGRENLYPDGFYYIIAQKGRCE